MSTASANQRIARAAGTVAAAMLIGQLAGLLRGILVARAFPAEQLDAFFAANRVSETLFNLIAGGALGSAFIPVFAGLLSKDEDRPAWRLASGTANLVVLSLSLLAGAIALFAPQLVRTLLAPGLSYDYILFNLTVDLLRIQLIAAVFFGLGGVLVGILNARQIFLVPALTPAMYQLGIIFGTLVLAPVMGIYGLAWGVVIGSGLYVLVQLPTLLRQPGRYTPTLGLDNQDTRQVMRLMGPRVLGVAVVQINFWVNNWLASQMSAGSVTGLSYGFMLMLMAQAAIAQSMGIAALPTFSAQAALGRLAEMRHTVAAALRGIMLVAIPASVGLMLLRTPLVSLLYERGEFTAETTALVAWALLWYAAGMLGHALLEVLARAFYALQDTRTPVLVGAAAMTLNVLFSFLFADLFERLGWMPHGGLALANSLATALEVALLLLLLRRRLDGIEGRHLLDGVLRFGTGALAMAAVLALWLRAADSQSAWLVGLGGVALGGAVYALGMVVLRVPEISLLLQAVRRRLQRS